MIVSKEKAFEYYKSYANKDIQCSMIITIDNVDYFLSGFKTFDEKGEEVFLTEQQLKESFEIWYKKNRNE